MYDRKCCLGRHLDRETVFIIIYIVCIVADVTVNVNIYLFIGREVSDTQFINSILLFTHIHCPSYYIIISI